MRSATASRAVRINTGTRLSETPNPPADLEAVDAGQPHVEHDRLGNRLHDQLKRLLAVLGQLHLISGQRQSPAQGFAHRPVVVDDEDPHEDDCCALALSSAAARP